MRSGHSEKNKGKDKDKNYNEKDKDSTSTSEEFSDDEQISFEFDSKEEASDEALLANIDKNEMIDLNDFIIHIPEWINDSSTVGDKLTTTTTTTTTITNLMEAPLVIQTTSAPSLLKDIKEAIKILEGGRNKKEATHELHKSWVILALAISCCLIIPSVLWGAFGFLKSRENPEIHFSSFAGANAGITLVCLYALGYSVQYIFKLIDNDLKKLDQLHGDNDAFSDTYKLINVRDALKLDKQITASEFLYELKKIVKTSEKYLQYRKNINALFSEGGLKDVQQNFADHFKQLFLEDIKKINHRYRT